MKNSIFLCFLTLSSMLVCSQGLPPKNVPLPYSHDTYAYYFYESVSDLLVDQDKNGPVSSLNGLEGFRWWHDNDHSPDYLGMSLTWSAYNKADLWVKGEIYSQGNLTVASANPFGQHDNFKVMIDGFKTQMISYGDEDGLHISSDLGNKIYVGDDNDKVFIGNVGVVKSELLGNYDLFVHKGILAEDLALGPKESWADYVFERKYKLKPLNELEQFISDHGHLPNIPSQKEVSENGYSMHDLNVRLLEKIEELTLHTIQQQKELDTLTKKLERLESMLIQTKPQ